MAVECLKNERGWSLVLSGIVDIFDAATIHAAALEVEQGGCALLDLDLRGLETADTSAAQVLLALRRSLESRGGSLRLNGAPPSVAGAWRAAGLWDEIAGPQG